MFCHRCGTQNIESAKFCRNCGCQLKTVAKAAERNDGKNTNKKFIYVIGAVLILFALATAVFIAIHTKKAKEYEEYLDSAEKYILEMEYDQAEDIYLQAINIAPKKLEAYVRLAKVYIDQGEYDEADAILERAEETGARGKKKVKEEFIQMKEEIEEQKNTISYQWVVEPTIEADDIYYVKYESENIEDPMNICKRQVIESYAVLKSGDALGLIDMDGKMILDTEYKDIQQYFGNYLLKSIEPSYYADLQMEWDLYSWDELRGLQMIDGLGGPGQGVFYYSNGLYNTHEDDRMFEIYIPDEAIPVQITDENYKGYESTGLWQYDWLDSQEKKYGVYYKGELVTDVTYDECGAASEGLLAVCKDGKWGYINQNGEEVIPLVYDASWPQYCTGGGIGESTYGDFCYAASDGYVVLCKDGIWELRDVTGKIAIPAGKFEAIRPVYQGKCWVKQDGKWGVIELLAEGKMSDENVDNSKWKDSYIEYIDNNRNYDEFSQTYMEEYKLIDINGDDIPELYVNHATTAGGEAVCTYIDGKFYEQRLWVFGLNYIEKENIFMNTGGHMGSYYNEIYKITNDGFKLLAEGVYYEEVENSLDFVYKWNDTIVSEEEYNTELEKYFDVQRAISPYDGAMFNSDSGHYEGAGICQYDEIVEQIKAYP